MKKMKLLTISGLLIAVFGMQVISYAQPDFKGPEACAECHKSEAKAWQQSHHFTSFKKLHKSKDAKEIAKKLGIKRIKKNDTCVQCHYTTMPNKHGKIKPAYGTSCESCHGASKHWIKVHNNYGGKDVKKAQETAEHQAERIRKAVEGGMIRKKNIYNLARNCFQCHTVPHEKLVVVGGHKAGSDFELVTWLQGEVKHNFLRDPKTNEPTSAARKRILYVAGRILDLEYGLRGVAEVTQKNTYAVSMAKRSKRALGHVEKIKNAINDPRLTKIFEVGKAAKLKANNKTALLKAADAISGLAQDYLKDNDGSSLAAIDSLIPSKPKGTVFQ